MGPKEPRLLEAKRVSRKIWAPPAAMTAIMIVAIILLHIHQTRAGLIEIYHKYKPALTGAGPTSGGASETGSKKSPTRESLVNQTLASLQREAAGEESVSTSGDQRRATIELHSPMKRILDLIGHHAPVIVVDSSSDSTAQEQVAGQSAMGASPQQTMNSVSQVGQGQPEMSQSAQVALSGTSDAQVPQLQTQQQQQHWTIVDTSQLMPQQQQQQAGTVAQQQQLIQTSVPNEQFYTFTPFGLQPTSNPFAGLQQGAFLNPYMMQQAQQQSGQQMTQSSQNYQQQQQAGTQQTLDSGAMNQAQPIFLSSYVPELPAPGSHLTPMSYNGQALSPFVPPSAALQQQLAQQQQTSQQPNSIQQQIRAQNEEQPNVVRSEQSGGGGDPPNEDPDDKSFTSKSKDQDEDEPPSSSGPSDEPDDEPSDASSPSSGSSTYEDKYDSDKDEPQSGSTSRFARQEPASSSSGSTANGLISVGLNNDCLQCICRASSGCDEDLGCITIGANEKYCGPFQLTEDYWNRAGSPGDSANEFSSFEECANETNCAAETVTNYMKKYYRDCDDDRNVTCVDYALLHRLGPDECGNTQRLQQGTLETYWEKFQRCAEGYNRMRDGDDERI